MTKRVGDYELGPILGQGAFGIVRQATNITSKQDFAIKIIDKEKIKREELIESLKKEIHILMIIDHPNIVKLNEVLASKTKIYLVLEWIKGGELFDIIRTCKQIPEQRMKKYFRQIIRAIKYCQSKQIAHRDLKPENILVQNETDQIKVNDFGLSSLYQDPSNLNNELYTTCGTVHYLAPEVIQSSGYDGHKADIWSLGVILYFSCSGYLPFEDDNVAILLDKIISANYFPFPKSFSNDLKNLLQKILVTHPNKRISIDGIIQHPWFQQDITQEEQDWFISDELLASKKIFNFNKLTLHFDCFNNLSQEQKKTIKNPINIRQIKGFELICFLTGKVVSQLPLNKQQHFFKGEQCLTIQGQNKLNQTINLLFILQPTQSKQIENEEFLKLQFTYKMKGEIKLIIEIFWIIQEKFLISIQLIQGTLETFETFLDKFNTLVKELKF